MNPIDTAWSIIKNSKLRQTELGCPKCNTALLKNIDTGAFFCPQCGWASDEPHTTFGDERSDEPSRGSGSWSTGIEEGVEY